MKDITHENVSLESVENLLNFAADRGLDFDTYEGVLNDLHIIYADRQIKIGRAKPREYIVCYYTFAGAWHNTLHVLQTDSYDKVMTFIPEPSCELCGDDDPDDAVRWTQEFGDICAYCLDEKTTKAS